MSIFISKTITKHNFKNIEKLCKIYIKNKNRKIVKLKKKL